VQNPTSPGGRFHLLFLFFASVMFAISVSSLFFYHLYLTGKNRTTLGKEKVFIIINSMFLIELESFRAPIFADGPQKEGFNLGYKQNFQEIFGKNISKALIPISTT
jgi:palmitoyltransferase